MRRPRALSISVFVLAIGTRLGGAQAPASSDLRELRYERAGAIVAAAPAERLVQDSVVVSHRRANVIGATVGVVLGGIGTAAYILNALAPDCVTLTSGGPTIASSHHCTHRSRIVVFETVTIGAGATAGGFGGAWLARRVAAWREHRRQESLINER